MIRVVGLIRLRLKVVLQLFAAVPAVPDLVPAVPDLFQLFPDVPAVLDLFQQRSSIGRCSPWWLN